MKQSGSLGGRIAAADSSCLLPIHLPAVVSGGEADMYGSEDLNLPFAAYRAYGKQRKGESEQSEESDLFPHDEQTNLGLLRYRSAPGVLLHGVGCDRSTNREAAESLFARFVGEKQLEAEQRALHSPQQQRRQQHELGSAPALKSPYGMMSSTAVEKSGEGSSILRRNTSPADLFSFSHLNETGRQISFAPRQDSSGFVPQISKAGSDAVGRCVNSTEVGGGDDGSALSSGNGSGGGDDGSGLSNGSRSGGGREYTLGAGGYPIASLEDPVLFSNGLSGSKRTRYQSELHFSSSTQPPSLPTSSPETPSSMQNLRQLEGGVPCHIRAKRGCATHPRSIAERVRRTKISERMKKLQDLVPNMHKQTNTADMLDLAVDYVKDLQNTVQVAQFDR